MLKDILPPFTLGLSPMDDVTTKEYRQICKRFGADVLYTEFVASDALVRDVEKSYDKASFAPMERPIGIQIFGNEQGPLVDAAQRMESFQPDFIDINWGCPMKKVAGKGGGSGILADIPKMISITSAIVKAVKTPVTVKTRLGYDEKNKPIVEIAERLQDVGIQMIAIHGRTKQQMYRGDADWTLIGKVKENPRMTIPVFGNGDINSVEKLLEYKNRYGVDGILVGRHAVGNPFFFRECKQALNGEQVTLPTMQEKVDVCREHLLAMCENIGESRAIPIMKKFYARYFLAVPGFKPYKLKLMETKTLDQVLSILKDVGDNL